jgi:pantoate--beta-alanine ligase
MKVCTTIAELRTTLAPYKKPALVPTMGNLHAGHLSLIAQAKPLGDVTVASIFVNRLQFLPHEDFGSYPRTFESDCANLAAAGCDVVFAPDEKELYPQPQVYKIHPPAAIADVLEGHFRPGFYVGVATVVMKLFAIVLPRVAVFGKKDYQQLMVIRNMVQQFALPIVIVGSETTRAEDGLALSSRNGYLSNEERAEAPRLNRTLREMIANAKAGMNINEAQEVAMNALRAAGWAPDYAVLRARADLSEIPAAQFGPYATHCVALAAARLGKTRLIDQLEC